jgi:MarR family transcriptional regulator for hemolysin
LADAIGIEGASLVRLIDELQSSGLVTREPDPSDRRANVVSLTPRGREVVTEVNEDIQNLREQIFASISAADIQATGRVFSALKEAAGKDADQA